MTKLMTVARRFHKDEDGAAMVEYSILLGMIAAATIAIIAVVATWVGDQFSGICANMNSAGTNAAGSGAGTCDNSVYTGG